MEATFSFSLLFPSRADRRTHGQRGLGNIERCITCSRTVKMDQRPTLDSRVDLKVSLSE